MLYMLYNSTDSNPILCDLVRIFSAVGVKKVRVVISNLQKSQKVSFPFFLQVLLYIALDLIIQLQTKVTIVQYSNFSLCFLFVFVSFFDVPSTWWLNYLTINTRYHTSTVFAIKQSNMHDFL